MPPFEFLGPYRIGKPLGRGGMGTVFAAVHVKTGEKVAVKLISAHVADEKRFRRRFDDEVKTLQQLKHKNIVRLIGFGEEEGQLFYSMELVEGETLQQWVRREKKVSWLPAINIAIEVCAALKHAHDFGVIHRDLKPANLMLAADNGVKLVDWNRKDFRRRRTNDGWSGLRDGRLHGTGTGNGFGSHGANRLIRARQCDVRDADRAPAVSRQERHRSDHFFEARSTGTLGYR
jgi:serine/threonine protein kinase